ncbi:MAG: hypothetical protein JXA60_08955 [Candidatus Coatesbacteria bacterium]|nr:hypothetical protein [Candidatus Coatesbacteria bacterium]
MNSIILIPFFQRPILFTEKYRKDIHIENSKDNIVVRYKGGYLKKEIWDFLVESRKDKTELTIISQMHILEENREILIIKDHINLWGFNPLIGKKLPENKSPFIDLDNLYDQEILERNFDYYSKKGLKPAIGIQLSSNHYPLITNADKMMARKLGASCIGLTPEAIAAYSLNYSVSSIALTESLYNRDLDNLILKKEK